MEGQREDDQVGKVAIEAEDTGKVLGGCKRGGAWVSTRGEGGAREADLNTCSLDLEPFVLIGCQEVADRGGYKVEALGPAGVIRTGDEHRAEGEARREAIEAVDAVEKLGVVDGEDGVHTLPWRGG